MKAVYVEEPFKTVVKQIPKPIIGENEVLIKVRCAGVCGSDLHVYRGAHAFRKPPVILGHEMSGVIEEIGGKVTKFKIGDRVTVMPQISCGKCNACISGYPNICSNKKVPGVGDWIGTFGEYFNAPEDIVVKLPENVDFDEGAMAEPLAVAIHVLKSIDKRNRNHLIILGSGTIGLLIMAVAPFFGFNKILTTDILDYNLKMAQRLGATRTVNVLKENYMDIVKETFEGKKADAVIIAAGGPNILDQAIESVNAKGIIVYLAMITKPVTFHSYPIVYQELMIKGSQTYTIKDFMDAVDIIAEKKINFKDLITHRYDIDDVEFAMELVDKKLEDSVKVMLHV